jgi:hypothetical protein
MKKQLLTICGALMISGSVFAQFTAAQIWSLNLRVDPISHNSINLAGIQMDVTYNSKGIPLSGISSAPVGYPTFRITSTVTGNSVVCISSEKDGNTPWEDTERATFTGDGINDTSILVERSNNGSPFTNDGKVIIQRGSNPNQFAHHTYRWINSEWQLTSKAFYYTSNNRVDSVVGYKVTGSDSTRSAFTYFYYSNGLDSTLETSFQVMTNRFELVNKCIVELKESGKTKSFGIYNSNNGTWNKSAVVTYSNGPTSSINENEVENAFSIYPNPATATLQLTPLQNMNIQEVALLNMNGQKVKAIEGLSTIDISDLTNGLYFLQIISDKGTSTQKFIKN